MCLGIPGKIVAIDQGDETVRAGRVSFGGAVKTIDLSLVPDAGVGDYVVVHAGFAISVLDEEAAAEVWRHLEELAALEEGEKDGVR